MTDEQIDKRLIKVLKIYLTEREMPPNVAKAILTEQIKCRERIQKYIAELRLGWKVAIFSDFEPIISAFVPWTSANHTNRAKVR